MNKEKQYNKLVPKLRFPEFVNDGEWKEEILGGVADIVTGTTPKTAEPKNYNGDKLFASPADISENRYLDKTNKTLSQLGFSKSRVIPENSILFVCIGSTIGKIAQNRIECATNQQINSLIPFDKHSNDFIYSLLEYNSSRIALLAGHQAVPLINKTDFSEILICIPPSKLEQKKIANCLSSLDNLITAETEKLALLKNHKKGLLQQLFPAKGEKKPQFRFPEFVGDGDWEEDKLSNLILNISPPKKLKSSQFQENGKYPIIDQSQNKIAGWSDDEKAIVKNDFPLIIFGDHTCVLKIVENPFVQGADGIKILKGNTFVNTRYLYYALQNNPLMMKEYKRHYSILKEKLIFYPDVNSGEQQKIANCLSSLDDLIEVQT
ncbi:MAG TPA: hypothetical protein EYG92_09550, partial [Lutibacter sp.]|nr:hypothetical protein [Lutibacter sp.]